MNVTEGYSSPDAMQTHVLPSPAASWLWYVLKQKPESWFSNKVATIEDTRFPSINENEADSAQHFQQSKQHERHEQLLRNTQSIATKELTPPRRLRPALDCGTARVGILVHSFDPDGLEHPQRNPQPI